MADAVPTEAWGFGAAVIGGALALLGRLVMGHWKHEEAGDDRLISEAQAVTDKMNDLFAEGRSLYDTVKADRDALRAENAELRARIRQLEGAA